MHSFYLINALPFVFTIFIPFLYKKFNQQMHTGWFILFVPLVVFVNLLSFIPIISSGETVYFTLPWIPSYNLNLTANIDGLSLIFGLIISGMGFLVILYSIYYMVKEKEALHNFYIYLLLFMGAMLGLVFSDNVFILYVFWEITTVSSFLLIAYWFEREKSRSGAQKSLLITVFGGLAMLAGFILLSIMADTNSLREMIANAEGFQGHPYFFGATVLILLGAFTKSAQFPFSIWLPDAMEAPTPISAYLHSATMVKAGIYLVARCTTIFGGVAEWFWLVTGVGLITLIYGSFNAVKQRDLKALLAYSTISQLGMIMTMLGLGSSALYFDAGNQGAVYAIAIFAALFHLVNHATFKGCLFMVVGIIDAETGTRDIRKLGGLIHLMPVSFLMALAGTLAMAGLPPFNGFLSKELFFTSILNAANMPFFKMETWGYLLVSLAWFASVLTFVYCMIILLRTFFGAPKAGKYEKRLPEVPIGMLLPPFTLAVLVLVIFLNPNALSENLLQAAWDSVLPTLAATESLEIKISHWHGFNPELLMTIGVVIVGTILYKTLKKWKPIYGFYPQVLTLNNIYNVMLEKGEKLSLLVTNRYMTGYLRDYLVYIFGFIILTVGGGAILSGSLSASFSGGNINYNELALIIGIGITAVIVLLGRTRLVSIIALGALGFLVVFAFTLFRAPDLALTQLVVETVTTTLFLLCLCHLPKFTKEKSSIGYKWVNGAISLGMGIVMTMVALSSFGNSRFEPISSYFENSYELAGANNIVNAILVDFRGFDTMLEILVLTVAGLGVYALINLRIAREEKNEGTE